MAGIADVVADFAGFGAKGATQAPVRDGNFLHQHILQDADRFEIVDQLSQQGVEVTAFFSAVADGDNDRVGQQTVLQGIEFDPLFAGRCPGAGGALGVAPVGLELLRASA